MSSFEEIGVNAKRLRGQFCLTQERLALEAGISQSYLRAIEHGNGNPTVRELEKIAGAIGGKLKISIEFSGQESIIL